MELPDYSQFIPNLKDAEQALESILDEQHHYQRDLNYHIEDAAFSGLWIDADRKNEITAYQTENPQQLHLEGHSASNYGTASAVLGTIHVSTIEAMMESQYGMIQGLDTEDFEIKAENDM
jgi:hypothetical protein